MKFPTLLLILVCLIFLITGAVADCEIDGDWTEVEYNAGDTMKFEGDISPSSGFIEIELRNPNNDVVAELSERQITDDFEFEFDTDDTYLNGNYKIRAEYTKYANGSSCDETLTSTAKLNTSKKIGDVLLNLTIVQNPGTTTEQVTGAPVQTAWGEISSVIDVTGPKGWASSFQIDGTKLAQGNSLGTVDLHLTQCQKNEDILNSYTTISDFLNSDYDNVLTLTSQNAALEERNIELEEKMGGFDGQGGMQGEINNLTAQVSKWKTTAENKSDFPIPFVLGIIIGFFLLILLRKSLEKMGEDETPNPVTEYSDNDILYHE